LNKIAERIKTIYVKLLDLPMITYPRIPTYFTIMKITYKMVRVRIFLRLNLFK